VYATYRHNTQLQKNQYKTTLGLYAKYHNQNNEKLVIEDTKAMNLRKCVKYELRKGSQKSYRFNADFLSIYYIRTRQYTTNCTKQYKIPKY